MELRDLKAALAYAARATTIYDVHAPVAYRFVAEVIEDRRHFHALDWVADLRAAYARDRTALTLDDHGAGPRAGGTTRKTIAEIAASSGTPERFGGYLLRAADLLRPRRVLELGTNLGLGTAYLAAGLPPGGRLVTIDADRQVLAKAERSVGELYPDADLRFVHGTFDGALAGCLRQLDGRVDLAFVDGHHEEHATVRYFETVLPSTGPSSVLIFDDIHWSAGMERAWRRIRRHPATRVTIDLFRWGVVFLDPAVRSPQHYTIVPRAWKPWHLGFFSSRTSGAHAAPSG